MNIDLINRNDAIKAMQIKSDLGENAVVRTVYRNAVRMLERLPVVDAEPVRHGKWIYYDDDLMPYRMCNLCGCEVFDMQGANYCPNCGAKMEEDE